MNLPAQFSTSPNQNLVDFEPEDFEREVATIRMRNRVGVIARAFGPKVIDLATKVILPAKP